MPIQKSDLFPTVRAEYRRLILQATFSSQQAWTKTQLCLYVKRHYLNKINYTVLNSVVQELLNAEELYRVDYRNANPHYIHKSYKRAYHSPI